jgi:hypothetical protein
VIRIRSARVRIGLAVTRDSIRGIALRRGSIVWADERALAGRLLDEALHDLFAGRRFGWPAPVVMAAVGPHDAQLKHLTRLPPLSSGDLERLVRTGTTRFFVRRSDALVVTGVQPTTRTEAWAAVIEEAVITSVLALCRAHRFHPGVIVPGAAALAHIVADGVATWHDGDVLASITLAGGRLQQARHHHTVLPVGTDDDLLLLPPFSAAASGALATLGPDARRYAAAFAAANLPRSERLVVDLARLASGQRTVPRWRIGLAAAAAALALVGITATPAARAFRDGVRDAALLAAIAPAARHTADREAALAHTTASLHALAEFAGTRHSAVMFLGGLARALPPDVMLVAVRLDSAGGTLVALAPRAAQVMTPLERTPRVVSPEIIGPVTREWVGPAERERVTIRFRWETKSP